MPYYHNMIGGPSDIEGDDDATSVTIRRLVSVTEDKTFGPNNVPYREFRLEEVDETKDEWNTPDMMKHRACHIVSELKSTGIKVLDHSLGGHTEGNSLN